MAYSSPATVSDGNVAPASWGNSVKAATDYLANPPACRVYHNTTQSVSDSVVTPLVFNSERFDTDTMHDTVTNTGRITFKTAGLYIVTLTFAYANAADYLSASAKIRLNGATELVETFGGTQTDANDHYFVNVTTLYKFAVNDYVEALAWQNNTANTARNVVAAGNKSPEFAAVWVGLG